MAELAALGVRRISVGSALSRAALGAFVRAAREIREQGTFRFAEDALPYAEANDLVFGTIPIPVTLSTASSPS